MTKYVKKVFSIALLMLLAMIIYCGKVEATEPESVKAYVAKKYEGGELVPGETYFVVETNIDSEVYITDSINAGKIEAITTTHVNSYVNQLYKKQDGSAFYDNVRVLERKGHFDTCTQGHVLYKNDKNILDRSTDKNLSGASNEYIYYCNGGGVKNLTVFLFSSLEETTITADDITVKQKKDFKEGDIPTVDDFELTVNKDG